MNSTIVWITGGSSGIGAALIETLPFADARVINISRSGDASGIEHLRLDLSSPQAWTTLEAHLKAEMTHFRGQRAIFIHSAAMAGPFGFVGEVDSSEYQRSVLLNAVAPQILGHAFLSASAGYKGDRYLWLMSSGVVKTIYPGWSSYCAGKAALNHWVLVAGAEQRDRSGGCQILAINPGAVDTPMQDQIREAEAENLPAVDKFRQIQTDNRLQDVRRVAKKIWGLLDDPHLPSGTLVDLRQRS